MGETPLSQRMLYALNKLCKWRSVFAGWQLGTRSREDPECQAVRDHREVTMILRAEMSALATLMIKKGVWTLEEWQQSLLDEAMLLDKNYEAKFPGVTTSPIGVQFNNEGGQLEWMKNWRP